jgi:hypothetical protein
MMSGDLVLVLSRLVFGAVATFLAIILWSNVRDTAWMFIIIATIVSYGETVLTTLEFFGLVRIELFPFFGVSVFRIVFAVLPLVFLSVGFAVMIRRRRLR